MSLKHYRPHTYTHTQHITVPRQLKYDNGQQNQKIELTIIIGK